MPPFPPSPQALQALFLFPFFPGYVLHAPNYGLMHHTCPQALRPFVEISPTKLAMVSDSTWADTSGWQLADVLCAAAAGWHLLTASRTTQAPSLLGALVDFVLEVGALRLLLLHCTAWHSVAQRDCCACWEPLGRLM